MQSIQDIQLVNINKADNKSTINAQI